MVAQLPTQMPTPLPPTSVPAAPVETVPFDLPTGRFYRVRVGRLASEAAARTLADQLHADEQLVTFVVRLDE